LQVDAIVNSTNQQLKLDTGLVSKAILNKGGKKIQQECQQKAPNGIDSGEVVVTSGGKLGCKFVIHGACCKWDGGAGASEQVQCCHVTRSHVPRAFKLVLYSSCFIAAFLYY